MNLRARAWIGVLFLAGLISCGKINIPDITDVNIPGVYRLDIQQGNVISAEDLARLESKWSSLCLEHEVTQRALEQGYEWTVEFTGNRGNLGMMRANGDLLTGYDARVTVAEQRAGAVEPSQERNSLSNPLCNPFPLQFPLQFPGKSRVTAGTPGCNRGSDKIIRNLHTKIECREAWDLRNRGT